LAAALAPLSPTMLARVRVALLLASVPQSHAQSGSTGACRNDCIFASDGDCDDSGPGAEFSSCSIGSDCADCGTRNETAGCSQQWCESPSTVDGTSDCWAGSAFEECSCSRGSARETGLTLDYEGDTYYEYTCCTSGGDGEVCGDYIGHWFGWVILVIVLLIICGVIVCSYYCCCSRKNDCCSCNDPMTQPQPPASTISPAATTSMHPGVALSTAPQAWSATPPMAYATAQPVCGYATAQPVCGYATAQPVGGYAGGMPVAVATAMPATACA